MWPELLDMTHEESKRILRRVELEAYSSVVSALRAQGDMNKEKKRILNDLQQILSISTERHRAEVRRAVNDEKLATIADNMSPSNSTQEWLIEGRRLVPLMPRLVPQTAFTVTANQVANMQAEKNACLPSPSQTGIRDTITLPLTSPPPTPWASRPSSPTSNVVVLPSGMSIHIKGGLNTEEDDDIQIRKRRRSTSTESLVSPTGTPVPQVTYTTTIANMPNISPKKITISKSPQSQPRVVASGSQTQKVILVSSQGQTPQGMIPQKSVSMPIVRSTVSTGTSTAHMNKSIIFPSSSLATNTNIGNVVTMATPVSITNTTATGSPLSSIGTSTTAFLTPTISVSRPRFKTVPRQKILQLPPPRPGVVIPMGPQPVQPSPQSLQGLKPVTKNSPSIQIRQEGGMKIITQNLQHGTSKILPKPSQMSTSGTPVVVVSAGSTSTVSAGTIITRTPVSGTPTGTKVLNIQTQGGKIISAPRGSSVVTVNPKTLHLTAVKNASGISGTKPNVIVVQKTQARRPSGTVVPGTSQGNKNTTTVISSPFEKELVSFLQKQDPTKQYVVTTTTANLSQRTDAQRKVIVTTSAHGDLARQLTQTLQRSKTEPGGQVSSNILQDLITAAGIVPDSNQDGQQGDVTINLDEAQLAALTSVSQGTTQTKVSQAMPSNEWFEYDVTDEQGNTYTHTAESADTAAAIQSLLDMQANGNTAATATNTPKPKVTVQRSASVDIGQLSDHLNPQQFYTIEQAMTILNQTDKDGGTTYVQPDSQTTLDSDIGEPGEMLTAVPIRTSVIPTSTLGVQGHTVTSGITLPLDPTGAAGELDPQTGMFYVDKNSATGITKLKSISGNKEVVIVKSGNTLQAVSSDGSQNYDLLSSSLAQAQIDLDPYQFIEEGQIQTSSAKVTSDSQGQMNVVVHTESVVETTKPDSTESIPTLQTEQLVVQKVIVTTPITTTTPSIRIQPSTFTPLHEVVKTTMTTKPSTINITTSKMTPSVSVLPAVPTVSVPASSIHVTVEPSGIDTTHMKMEDFTSQQQLMEKGEFVGIDHMEEIGTADSPPSTAGSSGLSDSQGEGSQYLDGQLGQGKRKRKTLSIDDVQSSPPAGSAAGSWVRAALGVLNKVSKYRGLNRDKTDLNAATWFVQPVDPADAPDYYTIVQTPMDFGTIKKHLEIGKYLEFEDFHGDMMLVKDNCCLYNPEQSVVRKDCDEVFNYYQLEYDKLMEKWQKTHIASPISKKQRTDRSPIRP